MVVDAESIGHGLRKEVVVRLVDDLGASHVKQLLELAIDQKESALKVLQIDHRRGVVQYCLQPGLAQPVLFLFPLAFGDVPADSDQPDDSAGNLHRRLRSEQPSLFAACVNHRLLPVDQWLARLNEGPLIGDRLPGQVRRTKVQIRFAVQLLGPGGPQEPGQAKVGQHKTAFGVFHVDGVRPRVHQPAQQLPLLGQRLFPPLASDVLAGIMADGLIERGTVVPPAGSRPACTVES